MKDHPTPQPSGRTIISNACIEAMTGMLPNNRDFMLNEAILDEAQRQLFNAICSEVIGEDEPSPTAGHSATHRRWARSALRREIRQKLRIFFNQPPVNEKPGTVDVRGSDGNRLVKSLPVNNDISAAMQLGQNPGSPTRLVAPSQPEKETK